MDAARQLAQLGGRLGESLHGGVQELRRPDGIRVDLRARHPQLQAELHEPLLRPVVEVALELAARLVRRLHDPRARGAHLGLGLLAVGDVAHVPGEAALVGQLDPRDRELHRERRCRRRACR